MAGYVSNCKHVPFNELLFVAHAEERCVDKNMKRCRTFDRSSSEDEKAWSHPSQINFMCEATPDIRCNVTYKPCFCYLGVFFLLH